MILLPAPRRESASRALPPGSRPRRRRSRLGTPRARPPVGAPGSRRPRTSLPPCLRLLDPGVIRVEMMDHLAAFAGHDPQVVERVAGRRNHRVVAAPDEGRVTIADREHFRAGVVVADLDPEPLGRIDLEEVYLLEPHLIGRRLTVVLVRRIRRPVAGRVDRLAQQEPSRGALGTKDCPDASTPVALAGLGEALVRGPDDARPRRRVLAARRRCDGELCGTRGLQTKNRPWGGID